MSVERPLIVWPPPVTLCLQEKLKREFRQGNAQGEDAVSDDEDLFGEADQLGDAGKAIKKALRRNRRRRGGDDDDDSDGNSNPYASSEEESSEEDEPVPDPAASSQPQTDANGQATILLPDGTRIAAPPVRPIASRQPTQQQQQQPSSSTVSRHPSPGPPSVGAQILAQRATSPHRPNRSRSASRDRGRTASPGPTASGAHSREASPAPGASGSGANKRKSTPEASGASAAAGGADDNKRARVDGQQPGQQQQQPAQRKLSGPSERVIVEYIRKFSPDIPQLIKHFKRVRCLLFLAVDTGFPCKADNLRRTLLAESQEPDCRADGGQQGGPDRDDEEGGDAEWRPDRA